MTDIEVRDAGEDDLDAIAAVAIASGQDEEWAGADPGYVRHLLAHGRVVVAVRGRSVTGFGATRQIGTGAAAVCVLCDLFVDPRAHGSGYGRAMLAALWRGAARRMTFSSLHPHAMPLYASFGVDAWWPLLYVSGDPRKLPKPGGWNAEPSTPDQVGALELEWSGVDRTDDHRAWAARPAGSSVVARHDGRALAAGTIAGASGEYGLVHLALAPEAVGAAPSQAVLAVLAQLDPKDGTARVCLPAPHPATRPLLAAGWRIREFDLFMASEPGLLDPQRCVPSPAMA